jgi:hypothetical protein
MTPSSKFVLRSILPHTLNWPGWSRKAETWLNRPPTRIVQDTPARAEIGRTFKVLWSSQVDPLDKFSTCYHVVANALHAPQTSTICRKRMVINLILNLLFGSCQTALWLPRYGGSKFGVWGMCRYVMVFACMCSRYMHVSLGIQRYTYHNICISKYLHVYAGIACMCRYQWVCAGIAGIGPLQHGNHHHVPKTPSCDPTPGGPHSGHPRACAHPLSSPIPVRPLDPIFGFSMQNQCLDRSAPGHRNRLNPPDRPKHGLLAL